MNQLEAEAAIAWVEYEQSVENSDSIDIQQGLFKDYQDRIKDYRKFMEQ